MGSSRSAQGAAAMRRVGRGRRTLPRRSRSRRRFGVSFRGTRPISMDWPAYNGYCITYRVSSSSPTVANPMQVSQHP